MRTPVSNGLSAGGQVQLLEVLSVQDPVISNWCSGLEDGAQVTLSGALPSQQEAARAAQEGQPAPEEGQPASEEGQSAPEEGQPASDEGQSASGQAGAAAQEE